MLRYLIPSTAIVALCLALYATSLHIPPSQEPATVVPEPAPSVAQTEPREPSASVALPKPALSVAQTEPLKPSAAVVLPKPPAFVAQTDPTKPLPPVVPQRRRSIALAVQAKPTAQANTPATAEACRDCVQQGQLPATA
jgi:hypothetical protein